MGSKTRIQKLIDQNEVLRPYQEAVLPNRSPSRRFLDLSCGTRPDIKEVVEGLGHVWVGVDQIDRPGIVKANVHYLPFASGTFDVVFSAATFEHYYNPWQVALEVNRVLKPDGFFVGLIAFLQPWHGDSYYHFTHLGTKQMLLVAGFEVLDIRAGNSHGVQYLIEQMFPRPPLLGKVLAGYGRALAAVRRFAFPTMIRMLDIHNNKMKERRMQFLHDDDLRFAASIIFLSRKASGT